MKGAMRPTPAASVCLISTADGGASNGTGFVVEQDGDAAWVLTCSHVIGNTEPANIRVSGRPVTEVRSAVPIGLDLALLKTPGLVAPVLRIDSLSFSDQLLSYYGFSKLYLDDYMRTRVDVRLVRTLDLQHAGALQSYLAYEIAAMPDAVVQPGHSGAPLVVDGAAAAMISHRLGQGDRGLAIALAAALRDWPEGAHLVGGEQDTDLPPPLAPPPSTPPTGPAVPPTGVYLRKFEDLPPPTKSDPEDDNDGRFGPSSKDGLVLRAELKSVAGRRSFFVFDLIVEALPGKPFDVEAVRFVLHSSFSPRTYIVRRREGATEVRLEDITSYGVFTAGAQVRRSSDKFTLLGYEVGELPTLPKEFLSR
jgi:hypothetical protein